MNVRKFLEGKHVAFETVAHSHSHTASRLAQATHVQGDHVAKAVLLHVNHGYVDVIAVVPATAKIDFAKVSALLGGAEVRLANESDISIRFPDCELGALPPFGSQYGMRTLVDESLVGDDILFESNTHSEAIRMRFADYREVESPLIGQIAATAGAGHG